MRNSKIRIDGGQTQIPRTERLKYISQKKKIAMKFQGQKIEFLPRNPTIRLGILQPTQSQHPRSRTPPTTKPHRFYRNCSTPLATTNNELAPTKASLPVKDRHGASQEPVASFGNQPPTGRGRRKTEEGRQKIRPLLLVLTPTSSD
uniref:Uncharacterized protein n=1 Tax=Oryza brachyantha TaxID=4533 RepID=J3MKV7_ORYBR